MADGIQISFSFTGAERPLIKADYPLQGDLCIPARKSLAFEYFITVLAWCETFDVDEDNNFTRPTCTVTNSLFSIYKKKPQEIFKAAENAPFFMMA